MQLSLDRLEVETEGASAAARPTGSGPLACGPLEVDLAVAAGAGVTSVDWALAVDGDEDVPVRSVALVWRIEDAVEPIRIFCHGYQSWSRSGVAVFGRDRDPSTTPGSLEMMQGIHHADQRVARPDELRSEAVTVLEDASGDRVSAGFAGGVDHDGTWRLRRAADGGVELWAEAFLGDALVGTAESRPLHGFRIEAAAGRSASELLEDWAARVGASAHARVAAPYQVGWCSWYHYFHAVTEADLRNNLVLADDWPFDVFQLDDGFQSSIGDWLDTNERFPSTLDQIAGSIAAAGRRPGLWIAPFIVAPDSEVARSHPEWLARMGPDQPLYGMFNPEWGGGEEGFMYALDTTDPEVIAHLEHVGRSLVDAGFTYLKLDFTFAPSYDGTWSDPSRTPAQRVRAGFDAIRRGAGDQAFILGCGAPLSHVVGVVDGNRIGADVAPTWEPDDSTVFASGYAPTEPSTRNAWVNTLTRSFQHRRLWLNDPDCLMLRTSRTTLSPEAVRTWAHAVAVSGGMALVSDDLSLLDADARRLLDEVVEIGRAVDAGSVDGPPARCPDLMDHEIPQRLLADGYELVADPSVPTSRLS